MKEVVLDTETTGLGVKDGHRIVEIGCIELENQISTSKKFHCYLNPERNVSEKALEIHGYSDEFLSKQKKFLDICDDFLNFIKDKKLIMHNADFDLAHLNNELSLINKEKINKRLKKRYNFNIRIFKKLKKLQLPLEIKKKKSNFILKNNFKSLSVKKNVKILKNKIFKNDRSST